MKKEKKKAAPKERGKPISLYPLKTDDAIRDLLAIKPPGRVPRQDDGKQ